MRLRTIASDVLFTISGLAAAVGIHKYVFGDFPKLWLVRDWPWHAVNPWIACGLALVLAAVAARVARAPVRQQAIGPSATPAGAHVLPNASAPMATDRNGQRQYSSARRSSR